MVSNIEKEFRAVYGQLLEDFKKELIDSDINPENLPSPFLPDFGEYYEGSDFKFAFVGIDSKENCDLEKFLASQDPFKFSDIINYDQNNPNDYPEFLDYTKKATSFWRFVLKFLSSFYNIQEWEKLRSDWNNDVNKKILGSFVHGNVDSINSQYQREIDGKEVNHETWEKVKKASKQFDKASHIINVFKPNVILLLNWKASEDWFPEEIGEIENFDPIKIKYYFIEATKTHLYWTYHPRGMININPNDIILNIIKSIKEKKIFTYFPGEHS